MALGQASGKINQVDLSRLRDKICLLETRHLKGIKKSAAKSHKHAVGKCQILVATAQDVWKEGVEWGYLPPWVLQYVESEKAVEALLQIDEISEGTSLSYLRWMVEHGRPLNVKYLAYYYNAGPNSPYGRSGEGFRFAEEVYRLYLPPTPSPKKG